MTVERSKLVDSLENNVTVLEHFLASIRDEERSRVRGPGYWSIDQHMDHLVVVQSVGVQRLNQFLAEVRRPIVPLAPDRQTSRPDGSFAPSAESFVEFRRLRTEQVELIRRQSDEVWSRTIEHPEYATFSFEIMVRHLYFHDAFHFYRMEELWILRDEFLGPL